MKLIFFLKRLRSAPIEVSLCHYYYYMLLFTHYHFSLDFLLIRTAFCLRNLTLESLVFVGASKLSFSVFCRDDNERSVCCAETLIVCTQARINVRLRALDYLLYSSRLNERLDGFSRLIQRTVNVLCHLGV